MASKVFFTRNITPENVLKLYDACGLSLTGKVAVKVHSGEKGNQNFLRPDFWRPMIERVNGTVVECNTAYAGSRNTSEAHWQTMRDHGWAAEFPVDIMDEEGPDLQLLIPGGKVIQKNYVGQHLTRYDSLLVLSHFKGHPMGGFGGAIKQLSIGVASAYGKAHIHGAGNAELSFGGDHDGFLASMADAASSVAKRFAGKAVYINVMKNLSVDCDCCAVAENPCMADIGMMASLDPIAIDQACLDMVYAATDDPGQKHFLERVESRHGIYTVECAAELGFGSREYECISLDEA